MQKKKNPIFVLSKERKPEKGHYRRIQRVNIKMLEREKPSIIFILFFIEVQL